MRSVIGSVSATFRDPLLTQFTGIRCFLVCFMYMSGYLCIASFLIASQSVFCDESVMNKKAWLLFTATCVNPLNPELNPICYLLALLGVHHFPHVSRIRVKLLTLRRLMSYIYGAPILDVSRSHTTMQHSR